MNRDVLIPLVAHLEAGRAVAFCQVVATRGSTPQKAGAVLLLEPDGRQVGTLGGGCVEADVVRKAAGLVRDQGVEILSFVLDHDPEWADGLICGGRMTILAHAPRGPAALAYYAQYRDRITAGAGLIEAVAIDPGQAIGASAGDRFLFDGDGGVIAALANSAVPPADLAARASRRKPSEAAGWAFLPTRPTIRVIVVGAGHVGQRVAALAGQVDFEVWVVDDRPDQASAERFPTARRRIIGPIAESLRRIAWTPETYALIVTRGHGHDQEALGILAPTTAAYVGLIGSNRKIRLILAELLDQGVSEASLRRVSAPVGLEIGSESVDEIAISIVAELIARRNLGREERDELRSKSRVHELLGPDVEQPPGGDA